MLFGNYDQYTIHCPLYSTWDHCTNRAFDVLKIVSKAKLSDTVQENYGLFHISQGWSPNIKKREEEI